MLNLEQITAPSYTPCGITFTDLVNAFLAEHDIRRRNLVDITYSFGSAHDNYAAAYILYETNDEEEYMI